LLPAIKKDVGRNADMAGQRPTPPSARKLVWDGTETPALAERQRLSFHLSSGIVFLMISRRTALASSAAALASARPAGMYLCLHQPTSAAAGFRGSLEGWAKAGIRYVELILNHIQDFVKAEGMTAAKLLLSDLGLN